MPFSETTAAHTAEYWTSFYKDFLQPALRNIGLDGVRSEASPRNIIDGVLDSLFTSGLVLVILTDSNANVWYELGVRHAIRHGTIMAIEDGMQIPFDLAQYGVLQYRRDDQAGFERQLLEFVKDIKKSNRPDSPVGNYFRGSSVRLINAAIGVSDSPLSTQKALDTAQRDLFIIGQNLHSLAFSDDVRDLVHRTLRQKITLKIRIMLADPEEKALLDGLALTTDERIAKDLHSALGEFRKWQDLFKSDSITRFAVKLCGNMGNISATFADADTDAGLMMIRPVLYHTRPDERPCFFGTKLQCHDVFNTYYKLFDQQWRQSRPLL